MRELHQQYFQIQCMPLCELFKYANIVQESMKEAEASMEEAKSKMSSGSNKFRTRR